MGKSRGVKKRGLLSINPDPIKLVPAAQRDVWFRQQGWRCNHEDGRGQCTSRETRSWYDPADVRGTLAHFCERHYPTA